MQDVVRSLIALGASASANCRPCLEHHLGAARQAGASPEDIAAAIEIGLRVNEGAGRQTSRFVADLLGRESTPATPERRCC